MTCQGTDAESDLRVAVERLLTTEADDTSHKPRIVWSLYFNQVWLDLVVEMFLSSFNQERQ